MKNLHIFMLLIALVLNSCESSENDQFLNCSQLKSSSIDLNYTILRNEISKITHDLDPRPSALDKIGHSENLDTLIVRLNACENITAELRCYACIKTGPPQSEVIIKTDSSGIQIQRVIDILTPDDNHLSFSGIHF